MNPEAMPFDQIVPRLNKARETDLSMILAMTPPRLRVPVTLAFCELTQSAWAREAGLHQVNVSRWLSGDARMPLGAGFRLAKVVGIDPLRLFEALLEADQD